MSHIAQPQKFFHKNLIFNNPRKFSSELKCYMVYLSLQGFSGDKDDKWFGSVLKEALEDLSIKGHTVHCIKHQRARGAQYLIYSLNNRK